MLDAMTKRESRAVAIMALAVVLAGVFLLIEPIWGRYVENRQQISHLDERLVLYRRLAAQHDSLAASLTQLRQTAADRGYFLSGDSKSLGVAELQTLVGQIIDQSGGRLVSTQVVPDKGDDGLSVRIRIRSEGDMLEVRDMLQAIATHQLLMLLDNVSISVNRVRRVSRMKEGVKPLQVNFELTAFLPGGPA